eukprot:2479143-Pyramimonas_sp.AAC.1
MGSGVLQFAKSMLGQSHVEKVIDIKAHRSGEDYAKLDDAMRRLTEISVVADHFAKQGARMHEAITDEFAERMQQSERGVS